MSTKASIFLTNDNEHCYDETSAMDGKEFRLVLEMDKDNIVSWSYDDSDGWVFEIKGDSQLARYLRAQSYGKLKE